MAINGMLVAWHVCGKEPMKMLRNSVLSLCLITSLCTLLTMAMTGHTQTPPAWVSDGPRVDQAAISLQLPLEVMSGKLYVRVALDGEPRRFVFDTGSPSMINKALADALGLETVGQQQGRDAHGAVITSNIVQADLRLDDVLFEKVPLFAADFSSSEAARCLVGDGVLGSELLPLCSWQIDLPAGVIRCDSDTSRLSHITDAEQLKLHTFGYPHTPYLDVRFSDEARSMAMFDTGASGVFTLSPPDFAGSRKSGAVDWIREGFGSAGGSLGGQAADSEQLMVGLSSLSIGPVELGTIAAPLRQLSPSLIGAALLEQYIVTLDVAQDSVYLKRYETGSFNRPSLGFTVAYDDPIRVAMVWDDTAAAQAGLKAGLILSEINGKATSSTCDGIQHALEAMSGDNISLEWEGGQASLVRETDHWKR